MYVIFINDSIIYLAEKPYTCKNIISKKYQNENFNDIVKQVINSEKVEVCFYAENLDRLWNDFRLSFKNIEAAGGLVFNKRKESLWIYRNERWDLPKGKIEKGESKEVAALREVKEECGVTKLSIVCQIGNTYHIYTFNDKIILKITYWYKMRSEFDEKLTPQLEENITKAEWIPNVKINEILKNTYGNIKLICKFASQKI